MGVHTQESLRRSDPLRCNIELARTRTYYPVGFRLDLATNSDEVLAALAEAWEPGREEFASEPMTFHVLVQPEGALSPQPTHRMRGHLFSVVADADNFAHLDLKSQTGFFHVSEQTAADHTWLRWYFVESMAYLMLAQRYLVPLHAACIARHGVGLLLSGRPGAGKSTLSYAGARAGWTFIGDDCTWILPESRDRIAIGRPRQARFRLDAPRLFPELEGYAICARPTGKLSIEVPLADLPHIRTAPRVPVGGIAFLERGPACAGLERLSSAETVERLLTDMPSYGQAVDALHEHAVRRLAEAPAWRLRYQALDEALAILESLAL